MPSAYTTAAMASAPFRNGPRVRAMPDVRFHAPGGLLRAPADRLPGPEDGSLPDYQERLRARGDLPRWLLTVDHALVSDFDRWARIRELVSDLWRTVGWPIVPVRSELTLGHRYRRPAGDALRPGCSGLVFVLAGRVTIRFWRQREAEFSASGAPPDRQLTAGGGELVYWPTGYWSQEEFGDDCLLLRLELRGERRAATAVVKNALVDSAQATPRYTAGTVEYLPSYAPTNADGATLQAEPVDAYGRLISDLAAGPEVERMVRLQWAARRSAAGLEPVPPPRSSTAALGTRRLRVTSEIVRAPDGADRAIWAVNGHLLPVFGAASATIRKVLQPGRELSVTDVCAAVGVSDGHPAVVALLDRLYRLRGLEAVGTPEVVDVSEPIPPSGASPPSGKFHPSGVARTARAAQRAEDGERP